MSGRTVPRLLLVALLAAAPAAPAVAQETRPVAPMPHEKAPVVFSSHFPYPLWYDDEPEVAPMPRAKAGKAVEIDLSFGLPQALDLKWSFDFTPAVPTMPQPQKPDLRGFADYDVTGLGLRMPDPVPPPILPATLGGGFGSYCAPAIPRPVAPAQQRQLFTVGNAPQIVLLGGEDVFAPVCPPCPLPRIVPNPLLGTWYRETPLMVISATFTHDELKLCMTQSADGHTAVITVTAHYTVTKDGLVFGAITGGDANMKTCPNGPGAATPGTDVAEIAVLAAGMQALVDAPFSFRTKMTSAGLMVSGLKCGTPMARGETDMFGGMYKFAKDGNVPVPTSVNTTSKADAPVIGAAVGRPVAGAVIGGLSGTTTGALIGNDADKFVPATPDCPRIGIDFNTNPPVMSPPPAPGSAVVPFGPPYLSREPLPPCQLPQPVKPVGCGIPGDSTKQMATEAFGQLLQQSGATRPNTVGGMTLPSGRYLEHYPQYFAPDPAFPIPRELAQEADALRCRGAAVPASVLPVASTGPVKGAAESLWYRDVAGKQCAVKLAPDHLTLTVSEAHEENGKVSVASLVITADYHMARDGITAVGLITSVDVTFEGEFPQEDAKPFFEMLNELQKALEDKPFALTIRAYDDALVIGNVRMPTVPDRMDAQPAVYLAGRYKSAGDKLPKLKAIKVSEPKALPAVEEYTLPPNEPRYNQPARPIAPNGDLLPPQAIPAPRIVPSSGSWTVPVPSMTEPTPPVPQMPQPVPPAVSSTEKKPVQATEMAVGWQRRITELPDPAKNGRTSPGIAGQMFLFGGSKMEFVPANGTLTVDLIDETPRPAGQPAAKPERWQFDKETVTKLLTKDETFGKSYTLVLPWPAYKPDITRVRISARYDPDNGHTLYATPSVIVIDTTAPGVPVTDAKTAPQMPQPVPPAPSVSEESKPVRPARTSGRTVILGVPLERYEKYSSDPDTRMRQLLYESEDLKRTKNEWHRFWFNDQPSHLTPERIHGGIY